MPDRNEVPEARRSVEKTLSELLAPRDDKVRELVTDAVLLVRVLIAESLPRDEPKPGGATCPECDGRGGDGGQDPGNGMWEFPCLTCGGSGLAPSPAEPKPGGAKCPTCHALPGQPHERIPKRCRPCDCHAGAAWCSNCVVYVACDGSGPAVGWIPAAPVPVERHPLADCPTWDKRAAAQPYPLSDAEDFLARRSKELLLYCEVAEGIDGEIYRELAGLTGTEPKETIFEIGKTVEKPLAAEPGSGMRIDFTEEPKEDAVKVVELPAMRSAVDVLRDPPSMLPKDDAESGPSETAVGRIKALRSWVLGMRDDHYHLPRSLGKASLLAQLHGVLDALRAEESSRDQEVAALKRFVEWVRVRFSREPVDFVALRIAELEKALAGRKDRA